MSLETLSEREAAAHEHAHDHDHAADDDPCAAERRVTSLLVAQCEAADAILVNKADLATGAEARTARATCAALRPEASIHDTTRGVASLRVLLPGGGGAQPPQLQLMLNGINCGGCAKAVREALTALDGVAEVRAQSKAESGGHPNQVMNNDVARKDLAS